MNTMLRKIDFKGELPAVCKMENADFPNPFKSGLEYNPPARGTWNIVHTGMLIPESHQIYVCAQGCLRGVILTAAEMNAMDRMSWVSVSESDMFDGTIEDRAVDGTEKILNKMKSHPKCVLLFFSCIHLFAGCDFEMIIQRLSKDFPDIDFVDCYMTPTMRKSISPDAKLRIQMYKPLRRKNIQDKFVNIIGCDRPTDEDSELVRLLRSNGYGIRDITECKSYDEYLKMGDSFLNITYLPVAVQSGEILSERLGQKNLYIPLCYSYEEIEKNYIKLCSCLEIPVPDFSEEIKECNEVLRDTLSILGNTEIAIDFTAVPRCLGLARFLSEHGFNVAEIYADTFSMEEEKDFLWLKENRPDMEIVSVVNVKMRFAANNCSGKKILAIGQKAAYYCQTEYFVNMVSGGGFYGFSGIRKLCKEMCSAFRKPKNIEKTISLKGLGCESCLCK